MNCDRCRTMLSDGATDAAADRHLRGCEACRDWAEALGTVRANAPALVASAPSGLADRVLTHVRDAPPVADGVADRGGAAAPPPAPPGATEPTRWWRRWRPVGAWSAGVAAATIGAVAIAQVLLGTPPGAGPPDQVLAAAAHALHASEATSDATSFRFDIEGELHATFALDAPEAPDLPAVPDAPELPALPELPDLSFETPDVCSLLGPELRERCEAEAAEGGAEFRRWYDEQAQAARDAYERQRERIQERVDQGLADLRAELERVTDRAVEFTEDTREVHVTFSGEGAGDGRGATTATVDYAFEAPIETTGTLEVTTVDGVTYVRAATTPGWIALEGRYEGFQFDELSAPRELSKLLDVIADPDGPVEELGEREHDGVTVRGLRLAHAGATITAWVGVDDGLLRELTHTRELGAPDGVEVSSRTTLRFHDFGGAVTIEPPQDATPIEQVPHGALPPFHLSVRLNLRTSSP